MIGQPFRSDEIGMSQPSSLGVPTRSHLMPKAKTKFRKLVVSAKEQIRHRQTLRLHRPSICEPRSKC